MKTLSEYLYYHEEGPPEIKIYNGDCLDILPLLPPQDLIFLDPPHNLWGEFLIDYHIENMIAFMNFRNLKDFLNKYDTPKTEIIWRFKDGRFLSNNLPRFEHEHILIYGTPSSSFVGEYNIDRKPVKKGRACIGSDKNLGPRVYTPHERKMLSSVIEVPKGMNKSLGVFGKPLKLVVPLLEWFNKKNVLDPFLGSGTSLIACKQLGMNGIGIEINKDYCEIAKKRLKDNNG